MNMAQVKEHPAAVLRRAVEILAGEGTAAHLIAALEAIAYTNVDAAPFNRALAQAVRLPAFEDADRQGVYSLACQAWSPWAEKTPVHVSDSPWNDGTSHGAVTAHDASQVTRTGSIRDNEADLPILANRFVDSVKDQLQAEKRQADVGRSYTSFSPAWELTPILQKEFAANDPAIVIGQHIDALFDVRRMQDPALGIFVAMNVRSGPIDAALIRTLELLAAHPETPVAEREVCAFICSERRRQPTEPSSWASRLERTVRAVDCLIQSLRCPQTLLTALVLGVDWENCFDISLFGEEDAVRRVFFQHGVRAFLSCSAPFLTTEAVRATAPSRFDSGELAALEGINVDTVDALKSGFGALFEKISSVHADVASQLDEGLATPILPPQILPHFLCSGVFDFFSKDWQVLDSHITGGSRYRREILDGAAPFALADVYSLWHSITHVVWSPESVDVDFDAPVAEDLVYLLAEIGTFFGKPEEISATTTLLPAHFGAEEADGEERRRDRALEYRRLYRLAVAEGLPSLGVALLVFFVVSQALRYAGRVGPWDVIQADLSEALSRDATGCVVRALELAIEVAEQNREALYVLRLRGLMPPHESRVRRDSLLANGVPGFGAGGRDEVLRRLTGTLGSDRVKRLSQTGRELLVDAVAKYSGQYHNMLYGVVRNWGTSAADFMKVFEAELADRLDSVYASEDYRRFTQQHRAGHYAARPGLGHFFHLLKDYKKLPPSVQTRIDQATSLHRFPRVLQTLKTLTDRHRNPGAHAAEYGVEALWDLLNTLFRDGYMAAFLDALSPSKHAAPS